MRVVSVNVGLPQEIPWRGGAVRTGIVKNPVPGPVPVRRFNLDGDAQADLTVHGGRDKAVYAYPAENYPYWRAEMPGRVLPWGMFGENLTTEGLLESEVCIGDEYRVGTARLAATQPRMPCFKLAVRFDDSRMVRKFVAAGRPGIYFAVLDEGEVGPGDPIERVRRDPSGLSVSDLLALIVDARAAPDRLRRALAVPGLAEVWRGEFESRLGGDRAAGSVAGGRRHET
jgi:MOSC domain-containing protein YiiM